MHRLKVKSARPVTARPSRKVWLPRRLRATLLRQRTSRPGWEVTNVDPNGIAADHGFKTGDVILDVGGKKVGNPNEVREAIRDAQKGGKNTVLMRVKSNGEGTKFVALRLGKA